MQIFHCNVYIKMGLWTFRGRIRMQTSALGIFCSRISHILGHKIKMRTCDCRWEKMLDAKLQIEVHLGASALTTSASLPCIMIRLCLCDKNLYLYLYLHPSYSQNWLVCMKVLEHHSVYMAMSHRCSSGSYLYSLPLCEASLSV